MTRIVNNPVTAGDVVVMYCNGLGAGLAPGYPDLYQVNAVVPSGLQPGSAVPVVLSVAEQTSPPVTMAVR